MLSLPNVPAVITNYQHISAETCCLLLFCFYSAQNLYHLLLNVFIICIVIFYAFTKKNLHQLFEVEGFGGILLYLHVHSGFTVNWSLFKPTGGNKVNQIGSRHLRIVWS